MTNEEQLIKTINILTKLTETVSIGYVKNDLGQLIKKYSTMNEAKSKQNDIKSYASFLLDGVVDSNVGIRKKSSVSIDASQLL